MPQRASVRQKPRVVFSGKRSGRRFDAENGVVTEALIFLGELDPEAIGVALEDATHYEPTPIAQFHEMLDTVPEGLSGRTFVDVGAGMGRIVLLASRHPFKQIVGVEVSPALCETARDNLVRWRRMHPVISCRDLRIVCRDANTFAFPPGPLVVYIYNPFGAVSVAKLAERLRDHGQGTYLLYHTAVHRQVLDADERFETIADLGFGVVYRTRVTKT